MGGFELDFTHHQVSKLDLTPAPRFLNRCTPAQFIPQPAKFTTILLSMR